MQFLKGKKIMANPICKYLLKFNFNTVYVIVINKISDCKKANFKNLDIKTELHNKKHLNFNI